MREILFRGKHSEKSRWDYGDLYMDHGRTYIASRDMMHGVRVHGEVIPDTVGQYTGLTDKNGTKIFEGDIVKLRLLAAKMEWKGVCEYRNGAFGLAWQYAGERYCTFAGTCNAEYEVLGNIHDNPELMEGE